MKGTIQSFSLFAVVGFKVTNCSKTAAATGIESKAISLPKCPESVDLPSNSVTKAPAKTPVRFISP